MAEQGILDEETGEPIPHPLGDIEQWDKAGYSRAPDGTGGDTSASGEAVEESDPAGLCPRNLTATENELGPRILYAYHTGDVNLGFEAFKERSGADVVKTVTYPPANGSGNGAALAIVYAGQSRTVPTLLGEENVYELDVRGHPEKITEPNGYDGSRRITDQSWQQGLVNTSTVTLQSSTSGLQTIATTYDYYEEGDLRETTVTGGGLEVKTIHTWQTISLSGGQNVRILTGTEVQRRVNGGLLVTQGETWTYDALGRLIGYQDAAQQDWTHTPDTRFPGMIARTTSPEGRVTEFDFDEHGNPLSTTLAADSTSYTFHDARGLVVKARDANGVETSAHYDPQGRLRTTSLPTGPQGDLVALGSAPHTQATLTYDYVGTFKSSEQDRNGVVFTYAPTLRGQVESTTRVLDNAKKSFTYDEAGNVESEGDWEDVPVEHTYDSFSQRRTTFNRAGDQMVYSDFDVLGNPWRQQAFDGVQTELHFDALSRLTYERDLNCQRADECPAVSNTFDQSPSDSNASHATVRTIGSLSTVTTDYDRAGRAVRFVEVTDGVEATTTNTYDLDGNLKSVQDPEGGVVRQLYDGHGWLTAALNEGRGGGGQGYLTSYEHDAAGNVVIERTFPLDQAPNRSLQQETGGGAPTRYVYDVWYRVREVHPPSVGSVNDLGTGVDPDGGPVLVEYDGNGNVTRQEDKRGHARTWERNALGWVERFSDASPTNEGRQGGCSATLCYSDFDRNGNPRRQEDARGAVTSYAYDAQGRITSATEPLGRSWSVSVFDGEGRPKITSEYGVAHEYGYNESGALISQSIASAGYSETTYYDGLGRVRRVDRTRDSSGASKTFSTTTDYAATGALPGDSSGRDRLLVTVETDGQLVEESTLDLLGNVLATKNQFDVTEVQRLDNFYRVERIERGAGTLQLVGTFTYYAGGMVRESADATGELTTHTYDVRGRLLKRVLPDATNAPSAEESYAYDANGNMVGMRSPTGGPGDSPYTVLRTYDEENRVASNTAAGEMTSYRYDVLGNVVEEKLPKNQSGGPVKTFKYDILGRLEEVNDRGLVTKFTEYDVRGNLKRQEVPGSDNQIVVTTFDYDDLDLLTKQTERNQGGNDVETEFKEFDPNGRAQLLATENGSNEIHYTYDVYGRRRTATYPSGSPTSSITWNYVDTSRSLTITEVKTVGTDTTVINMHPVWGSADDVARTQGSNVVEIDYVYHDDGQVLSVTTEEGVSSYAYNSRNQLYVAQVDGEATTYTYYADGRPDEIRYGNGTVSTHRYENTRRIDSVETTGGSEPIRNDYDYDDNGNRTFQLETRGPDVHATTYHYDDKDRMDRSEFLSTGASFPVVTVYGFDGANRASETVTVDTLTVSDKTFEYSPGNHLDRVTETGNLSMNVEAYIADYAYDDRGNLTSKEKDTGSDLEITSYEFDIRDHLRSVNYQVGASPPMDLGSFDYDHAGMRVRSDTPDRGNVEYFYDGSRVLEERAPNSGPGLARYHYGLTTLAVADITDPTTLRKYFHTDGLGTTSHLTDESANTRADYMVDPWGRPRDQARYLGGFEHNPTDNALTPGSGSADRNRKLFTGHEYDKSTGLIYAKARYYDPDAGRFLSRDSYLGDPMNPMSLHRYMYAFYNPTVYWDPLGFANAPVNHENYGGWARYGAELVQEDLSRYAESLDGKQLCGNGWSEALCRGGASLGLGVGKLAAGTLGFVATGIEYGTDATLAAVGEEPGKQGFEARNEAVSEGAKTLATVVTTEQGRALLKEAGGRVVDGLARGDISAWSDAVEFGGAMAFGFSSQAKSPILTKLATRMATNLRQAKVVTQLSVTAESLAGRSRATVSKAAQATKTAAMQFPAALSTAWGGTRLAARTFGKHYKQVGVEMRSMAPAGVPFGRSIQAAGRTGVELTQKAFKKHARGAGDFVTLYHGTSKQGAVSISVRVVSILSSSSHGRTLAMASTQRRRERRLKIGWAYETRVGRCLNSGFLVRVWRT